MFDDVDDGLCVKRSHIEHVTAVLSSNVDRHAGCDVGHVECVRVGTNGVDGKHIMCAKQHEHTIRQLGTHWKKIKGTQEIGEVLIWLCLSPRG